MRRLIILCFFLISTQVSATDKQSPINWQDWSADLFQQAKQQQRPVLLDLEAVWCHWCHVMDATTYQDSQVARLIEQHYLAVKVDHDARPDLAQRYRDYGWPATIIFAPDGTEIVKRAGYINPESMSRLLQAVIDDPSPEQFEKNVAQGFSTQALLSPSVRTTLEQRHKQRYDEKLGGLDIGQKFIERDSIEWALHLSQQGNAQETRRAQQTLNAAMKLIDPVWGGAYQYSTHGDWDHAHYEKIMVTQAGFIRLYAQAYQQFNDAAYLNASQAVADYLLNFLRSPEGAFYTSQDADLIQGQKAHDFFALNDQQRRKLGIPRIDKNRYSRENGLAIEALASLYLANNDSHYLDAATQAAEWIIHNRAISNAGFSHDKHDQAGPYLGDTLSMGRAFLALYRATGDSQWLKRADLSGSLIREHFLAPKAGLYSAVDDGSPIKPVIHLDENISAARFFNLLAQISGNAEHQTTAKHVMRYLSTPSIATKRITEAGILLADHEYTHPATHLTVVGDRNDPSAQALQRMTRSFPGWYQRIDFWNPEQGKPYNPDVRYPKLPQAAGFVCTDSRCSLPAFSDEQYQELIRSFTQQDEQPTPSISN